MDSRKLDNKAFAERMRRARGQTGPDWRAVGIDEFAKFVGVDFGHIESRLYAEYLKELPPRDPLYTVTLTPRVSSKAALFSDWGSIPMSRVEPMHLERIKFKAK